ncbi:MAG: amidase [Bacteroidota bacterium]|nr:amidase [Bacteroidota bacterium]
MRLTRRQFAALLTSLGVSNTSFAQALADAKGPITPATIACAEDIAGLTLTAGQREQLVEDLEELLEQYKSLRALRIPNDIPPALVFDPTLAGVSAAADTHSLYWSPEEVERPLRAEDLAFMSVAELAWLLRSRQVTSVALTELYLARLKQYDPVLEAVVTYTEERAFLQASRADEELDAGIWRGPLHGVPYGAKDLLATTGYATTWGAMPYRSQQINSDATVIQKLELAGAVLVAKLTLGALAWGDVWFGGKTKNPWNIEQGSSGSSAGPGSAVAAGLVGFAIGSETLGSIVSPSTRNGVTGHRPTFGRVSRHGTMTLSWSMDKLGPMARSALDCALVFEAIRGRDPLDPVSVSAPFEFAADPDPGGLRVGVVASAFDRDYRNREADRASLEVIRSLGIETVPVTLPEDLPVDAMLMTLGVEAAAAFDDLTLSGGVDAMVRQGPDTWPHEFRKSRFIPAVEFIQANRARTLLMQRMAEVMRSVDVIIAPTFGGSTLGITNLTGHPAVTLPNAFHDVPDAPDRKSPGSITFVGGLYQDAAVLRLAHAFQMATDFHLRRPPIH